MTSWLKIFNLWDYLDKHEKKLDLVINTLNKIMLVIQTLEKKEKDMANVLQDAITALQAEVGEVVLAEKAAVTKITDLVQQLVDANNAGNVDAVNAAIADLKTNTDALNATLNPVVTVPAPEPQPEAPPTG